MYLKYHFNASFTCSLKSFNHKTTFDLTLQDICHVGQPNNNSSHVVQAHTKREWICPSMIPLQRYLATLSSHHNLNTSWPTLGTVTEHITLTPHWSSCCALACSFLLTTYWSDPVIYRPRRLQEAMFAQRPCKQIHNVLHKSVAVAVNALSTMLMLRDNRQDKHCSRAWLRVGSHLPPVTVSGGSRMAWLGQCGGGSVWTQPQQVAQWSLTTIGSWGSWSLIK